MDTQKHGTNSITSAAKARGNDDRRYFLPVVVGGAMCICKILTILEMECYKVTQFFSFLHALCP